MTLPQTGSPPITKLAAQCRRLAEEIEECELQLVARDEATFLAARMWITAGRALVIPDRADLIVWLLERLDAAEAVIHAARGMGDTKVAMPLSDHDAAGLDLALHVAAYDDKYPAVEDAAAEEIAQAPGTEVAGE